MQYSSKIFIVDDSDIQLILLEKVLQREGFAINAYSNGYDLLDGVSQDTPDLIISDIDMPKLNGFDLIKEVQRLPQGIDVPFFLISSNTNAHIQQKAQKAGASRVLKKPFKIPVLLDVVEDLLPGTEMAAKPH